MAKDLTIPEALRLRLSSMLLAGPQRATSVAAVATWFGAMQAQDLASGKWSFGVRLPAMKEPDIDRAIDRGEVLRTWPMRGTLHFIPAEDARWMLELTGSRALAGAAKRRRDLGLTDQVTQRAVEILGEALAGGRRLTRSAATALLMERGIPAGPHHGYHLLWYACQQGIICLGPNDGKEQTFVLLDEWAPRQRTPTRDEALALLATRYFQSHGPATAQDFAGWTGLPAADAKHGIALAGPALITVGLGGKPHYLDASSRDAADSGAIPARALSGFDEFLLGLKDRTLVLDREHLDRVIPGGNGVFRPTMVHQGRVIGTWTRTVKKSTVAIQPAPFGKITRAARSAFEGAVAAYAGFLGREAVVDWG